MHTESTLTHGQYHDVTIRIAEDAGAGEAVVPARSDDGTEVWCVVAPGVSRTLSPGAYDLEDALGYDPSGESLPGPVAAAMRQDPRCPECDAAVEFRGLAEPPDGVDELLSDAGADGLALVITERTGVTERDAATEWTFPDGIGAPRDAGGVAGGGRQIAGGPTPSDFGTFVCPDCGHETDRPEAGAPAERTLETVDTARNLSAGSATMAADATTAAVDSPETLGMATGGGKDVANFRDNVTEGYLPQREALADEGLFYDYYFDTGTGTGEGLFYPTYSAAVSEHPLSGETERYLTVGLNATLTEADFERTPLNLVVVLDVSGSMSSQFDQYYYDEHGRKREIEEPSAETKMAAARESLAALTRQLRPEDRLGVVLFNDRAGVAKPLRDVETTDMDAIRGHVHEVQAGGGTNMADGFAAARELLAPHEDADPTERENRVVFMTDAMPNVGGGEAALLDQIEGAAENGVHTTFVGMGLDANAELIDALSGVRGANHYFVHSAAEFERRLGEEFAYMVTPLVYDLSVDVVADGYEIDAVYGSPNADEATGEVMHVTTLFPASSEDGENRGGVVLLKLERTGASPEIDLEASWVRRDGSRETDTVSVTFPGGDDGTFETTGVRKAVLLARYADLLREWVDAARAAGDDGIEGEREVDDWQHGDGEWERESVPLRVPDPYPREFRRFREHLLDETRAIGDDDLKREADLLETLITHGEE